MINGAHKIDLYKDLPRLLEMIKNEPNNQRVAENFRTHKGETISNEMVRAVRKGKRWGKYTNIEEQPSLEEIFQIGDLKPKKPKDLAYETTETKEGFITQIKDKVFGEIIIETTMFNLNGVDGVVQTYYENGYRQDENVESATDDESDKVVYHMEWIRTLITKHKMCKDLFILPIIGS